MTLPDGRLFFVSAAPEESLAAGADLFTGSLDSEAEKRLAAGSSRVCPCLAAASCSRLDARAAVVRHWQTVTLRSPIPIADQVVVSLA